LLARVALVLGVGLAEDRAEPLEAALLDGDDQRLLVGEVEVEGRGTDAGARGDGAHGQLVDVPGLCEQFARGVEQGRAQALALAAGGRVASSHGRATLLPATLRAGARPADVVDRLTSALDGDRAVALGGNAVAGAQVRDQATSDLAIAELIAFPLLALLSLL